MQRFVLSVTVGGLLLMTGLARGGDADDAQAIVDKAMKAAGSSEKLTKYKAMTFKEKGTYYGMGDGLPFTGNYAMQRPGQFRMEIVGVFTIVVNGDKGWTQMGGETKEMTKEQLAEQKEELYAGWVTSLAPLKQKGFTLKTKGKTKVGDAAANEILVEHKGHRPIHLYFDDKTSLLLKSQSQVKSQEMEGKEVTQEAFYSDYKKVQGVEVPMKIVIKRAGKNYVEAEMSDVKMLEKLDNKIFAEPK